jgi:hypothetical protein
MQISDDVVRVAKEAWLESASDYTRLDVSIRSALEAALAAMWKPISEAPKDGTRILMQGNRDPIPSQRELYHGLDIPTTVTGYWDQVDYAWAVVGSTWTGPFFKPSAWQPLPSPPSTSKEDGK